MTGPLMPGSILSMPAAAAERLPFKPENQTTKARRHKKIATTRAVAIRL